MRLAKAVLAAGGALLLIAVLYMFATQVPTDALVAYAEENRLLGAALLSSLMFVSTVIAPLTTLPLVPVVAPILGPFTTALASIAGWTLGSVVAFLLARYGGRPFIERFVSLERIDAYESRIPVDTELMLLIMLRIAIPVDVLSYALGLFSRVSLPVYTVTTLIGVSWFACIFAYLGNAAYTKDYVLLGALGVASVIILVFAYTHIRRHMPKR